ncbi:MAG TPA: hypothetical protein PLD47_05575 [Aggregatilineales bacterium]|nr:hypothetical protein [Anaerolineales bacterium]HRE47176.1 hypothetical protein [Aggregatilineales bacterium]
MSAKNKVKHAVCPTCQHLGNFTFLGEQKWPPEIAAKFGLPEIIILWSCPNCNTTISDPDLPSVVDSEDDPIGDDLPAAEDSLIHPIRVVEPFPK